MSEGKEFDAVATAERLYRSCKREGARVVVLTPDGRWSAMPPGRDGIKKIWEHEYHRILGTYDQRVEPEDMLEDVEWFAKRWGVI